jgi:hypothetical protein
VNLQTDLWNSPRLLRRGAERRSEDGESGSDNERPTIHHSITIPRHLQ